MSVVRWEEPRQERRGRKPSDHYLSIAAELRARPGAWALIHDGPAVHRALAGRITGGHAAFAPPGAFEAVTAANGRRVYARYVGDQS